MIYNDEQCDISRRELAKFKEAVAGTKERDAQEEWVLKLEIEGDIAHYERSRAGEIKFGQEHSLHALPSVLIQARIALGMSQTDLAHKLGLKLEEIQRCETTGYEGASLSQLIEISEILHVTCSPQAASHTGFRSDLEP